MALQELLRVRLQTLARLFTGKNDLTVEIKPGGSSTDFKKITVNAFPGEIVPGVSASREEIWLAQKAANAHEAGHIKFTDKAAWEEALHRGVAFRHLVNIIEDARIERAMANAYPGVKRQLRFLNEYIFLNRKDYGDEITTLFMGLCNYAVVGRIPEVIASNREILALIKKAAPAIDRGRLSPDTWGVLDAAQEVWEIIQEYVKDNTPDMPPIPTTLGTEKPQEAPRGDEDPRRKPKLPKDKQDTGEKPDQDTSQEEEESENEESEQRDGKTLNGSKDNPVKEDGPGQEENDSVEDADNNPENNPLEGNNELDESSNEPDNDPVKDDSEEETPESSDTAPDETSPETAENALEEDNGETPSNNDTPPESHAGPGEEEDAADTFSESYGDTEDDDSEEEPFESSDTGISKEEAGKTSLNDKDNTENTDENNLDEDFSEDDNISNDESFSKEETPEQSPETSTSTPNNPHDDSLDDDDEIGSDVDDLIELAKSELDNLESRERKESNGKPELNVNPEDIEPIVSQGLHRGVRLTEIKPEDLLPLLRVNENDCREAYQVIKSSINSLIKKTADEIRQALEYKSTISQRNLRRGRLDGSALWKLKTANPKVFLKVQQPGDTPTLAVYLLVDVSGSMSSRSECQNFSYNAPPAYLSDLTKDWWYKITRDPRRVTRAAQAACILTEVCKEVNIPHTVVGYTTGYHSGEVHHFRYCSWSEKEKHMLSLMTSNNSNRDGYSIRVATQELLLRQESRKVLIVLSDGKPADSHNNYLDLIAVNDTAKAVREAEKLGIGVIGIFFGDDYEIPIAQKIYNNMIYVEQLSILPVILGRLLKKVILG